MPLIYSFVARGTTVLADYTSFTGNFSTVAIQCLEKIPANNSNYTYTCDKHTFNYVIDRGFSECPHVAALRELLVAEVSQASRAPRPRAQPLCPVR